MAAPSAAVKIVIPQFRMHSQTFENVLDGIKEEDARTRIEGKSNHLVWMVGNMVNTRYWMAAVVGLEKQDPNNALFGEGKALDESLPYPTLEALKKEWHVISPLVFERLQVVTDEELAKPFKLGMNIDFIEENNLNMLGMAIDRESYLLGQLGLMRKVLGYTGMKYDVKKELTY